MIGVNTDRRTARVLAVQSLYQLDVQGDSAREEVEAFLAESGAPSDVIAYARGLVEETWSRRAELDEWIGATSKHWDIHRMATVDRNILRLGVLEMICRDDPPEKVAIDEAIELGKAFGTNDSSQFINGILDAIRHRWGTSSVP